MHWLPFQASYVGGCIISLTLYNSSLFLSPSNYTTLSSFSPLPHSSLIEPLNITSTSIMKSKLLQKLRGPPKTAEPQWLGSKMVTINRPCKDKNQNQSRSHTFQFIKVKNLKVQLLGLKEKYAEWGWSHLSYAG